MSRSVQRLVLRRGGDEQPEAVNGDQDAADQRGGVEPSQVELKPRRGERAIEQAELVAIPRREQADAYDQQVIEAMDPELRLRPQLVREHLEREVRALLDADCGAD